MSFSMGQNFLSSPGAQLLGALGIHLPGAQPQQHQQVGDVVQPSDAFAGMNFSQVPQPQSAQAPTVDLQPIPQPAHGGLFHRILGAMMAGG